MTNEKYLPLVSIIIPVYNGANYMRCAIDSALAQSYKNIEVIVVNDGAKDEGKTEEIALSYGDKIRYISKENGGVSSALNAGIAAMKGEYFSWLSHDDVYEQDKIEKQIDALQRVDRINTVLSCGAIHIDANSQKLDLLPPLKFETDTVLPSSFVLKKLLQGKTLNGCCLLIHKDVFEKCGTFDEKLRFCQDAVMWYKIFMNGYALYCTDALSVQNRVHEKQLTQTGQALFRKECSEISDAFAKELEAISDKENNYLKIYLLAYAMHLKKSKIKNAVAFGKTKGLISFSVKLRIYCMFMYGKIRPFIRKAYYRLFKGIKTS